MTVCRLCSEDKDLISVFDDKVKTTDNIINIIRVTTGVTIKSSDNVSQKVCNKCLNITINMFKFRTSSIINDMDLKSKAARKLKPVLNKSVEMLLKKYPKISLPSSIADIDISPVVKIKNGIFNEKPNRVKKADKKMIQQFKSITKLAIPDELPNVIDLENRKTSYVSQNKEIPTRPQLSQSTEAVSQNIMPTLSADAPEVTLEIDELQKLPQEDILSSNVDEKISRSITAAKTQDSETKRKLSVVPNSKKPKRFKSDTDSVNEETSVKSLVTKKYVTRSLLICDIRNDCFYDAKNLKNHKINQMRCHLCKMSFHSLEEINNHCQSGCTMKKNRSDMPKIMVRKCDQFKKQYPSLIGGLNKIIKEVEVCSLSQVEPETIHPEELATNNYEVDPVEGAQAAECSLISDGENEKNQSPSNRYVDQIARNTEVSKSRLVSTKNEMINLSKDMSTRSIIKNTIEKTSESPLLRSASVKPDININDEKNLDVNFDDTEINLLKKLIKQIKNPLKETCVQTDIPSNRDIIRSSNKENLFELKNLRKFLTFYRIPVNLRFARQYSVKFSFESSPTLKKDSSGNKIIPKITTPSKPSRINYISNTNTLYNTITYKIINNIPHRGLSSSCSVRKPTTYQQSGIGNIRRESNCDIATSIVPTILRNTASTFPESNNT